VAIPWQERPAGAFDRVAACRYTIIGRQHIPGVQGIYNSAVAPSGDGYVAVIPAARSAAKKVVVFQCLCAL
jgi:beta-1,4-mannooligosaccharide/beta-1,4-mannosyl-N-acetylglucosamine phosphorylase